MKRREFLRLGIGGAVAAVAWPLVRVAGIADPAVIQDEVEFWMQRYYVPAIRPLFPMQSIVLKLLKAHTHDEALPQMRVRR